MADFPAELSTGMVHGRFIVAVIDSEDEGQEPDVVPAQGKVAFKASVGYIPVPVATGGPVTVMKGPIMGVLDDDGYLCTPHPTTGEPMYRGVRLIATDDPDMAVTDWTWSADYRLEAVNGNSMQIPAHSFALPSGAELDLTTLVKVPSSPGYGLPQAEAAVLRAEAAAQVALDVKAMADAGEFDGAQGLPGNATMRVDTTVGTRVFISDGTTEKMVSGDTGWRKVIVAPKAGAHSGGEIRWRRSDNTVQLFLVGITLLEGVGFVVVLDAANIPLGFSAVATDRAFYLIGLANSATAAQVVSRYTSSAIAWNQTLSGSTTRPTSGGLQGVLEWTTSDPWPTALPGTPA